MTTYEQKVKNFCTKHNLTLTVEQKEDMYDMLSEASQDGANQQEMCMNGTY